MMIAGHAVVLLDLDVGPRRVRLCSVPDLEGMVDRGALLRGDAEPPYWAYLWSGARILASYLARWVDVRDRRVLEIGCGLGLPGVSAALLGADTTLVDAEPVALEFVAASAAANGITCTAVVGDFMRLDPEWRFDVVLAAEVAYDRGRFVELAAVLERHLLPGGMALLADGYRTDTRGLYGAFAGSGLDTHAVDVDAVEEGCRVAVRLTEIRRPAAGVSPRSTWRPPL